MDRTLSESDRGRYWDAVFCADSEISLDEWDSRELAKKVQEYLPTQSRILWFGVSYGAGPLTLARSGYRVVAVDISKRALLAIRSLVEREAQGARGVTLIEGTIESFSNRQSGFDGVVCPALLTYLVDVDTIRNGFATLKRSTKPDGYAFLSEPLYAGEDLWFYHNWKTRLYLFQEEEIYDYYGDGWHFEEIYRIPDLHHTTRLVSVARRLQSKGVRHDKTGANLR